VQRVKLVDVARAAGVHPGTASRALNPTTREQVSPETARRVSLAAKRLGYVPNPIARGLRTARSYVVGMVLPDVTNPLFPPMIRGAEQVLSSAGFTLVVTDTEEKQVDLLRARGVDGFILATARWHDPLLQRISEQGVPAVLVNRNTAGGRLPYVGGDDRTGIQAAVDHLAALGHRTIAHLAGPQDTSTGRDRAAAFRQAVRSHSIADSRTLIQVCQAFTEAAGLEATGRLLATAPTFTALVAGNDLIALGALARLAQAGLSCPGDVSVVGFNDLPLIDKLTPPLTTVALPLRDMGALAAQVLLDQIGGTSLNGRVSQSLLGVQLKVRGSTAPAGPKRTSGSGQRRQRVRA
jgi:LacI family transcriptional regulator